MPLINDKDALTAYLEKAAGCRVSITMTENTTSMLSVIKRHDTIVLRLHRMFLEACPEVMGELAGFITKRKGRTPLLTEFISQNLSKIRPRHPRKTTIRTDGRYHNLLAILDSLNSQYFQGRISCFITWSAKRPGRAARKRTLGSYNRHTNIIRISPLLDRRTAPAYFVEFVVYHEMLHADMEPNKTNGRRSVHCKEFRRRERMFRHYEKAIAWEKRWV